MKSYRGKTYLIISSAQLGMDDEILGVFKKVADHYNSEVIHLGPLALDAEVKTYRSLIEKIEVLKNKTITAMTEAQYQAACEKQDECEVRANSLAGLQHARIEQLVKKFGKVTLVTNKELSLPVSVSKFNKAVRLVMDGMELSKYLFLSSITPKGIKSTRNPMDKRAVSYLKSLGRNWISPFPVPSVEQIPKPGLNESYNYWTVGGLQSHNTLYKSNELYQIDHLPAAILVILDPKNGEFHARHMHIDYNKVKNETIKFCADDGLIFTKNKVIEVGSDDKASGSTDDHAPWQHPGTLAALRQINVVHKPATLINGGDASDFGSINRHAAGKPGETENMRLHEDINSLRALLDAQANVPSIKHKVMIDSNHHEWLTQFVMMNPCLIGFLDWDTLAKDRFSDWDVMIRSAGENKIYFFGDYMFRHGDKDGGAKKAEVITKDGKYACGHFHRYVSYRRAVQIGCGAMLGPAYTGNDVNAWQSQVFTFTKWNGVSAISPKIVIHDKNREVSRVAYRDTIYEVDFYRIKK